MYVTINRKDISSLRKALQSLLLLQTFYPHSKRISELIDEVVTLIISLDCKPSDQKLQA